MEIFGECIGMGLVRCLDSADMYCMITAMRKIPHTTYHLVQAVKTVQHGKDCIP